MTTKPRTKQSLKFEIYRKYAIIIRPIAGPNPLYHNVTPTESSSELATCTAKFEFALERNNKLPSTDYRCIVRLLLVLLTILVKAGQPTSMCYGAAAYNNDSTSLQ